MKPFLLKKRIAGTGKQSLMSSNWTCTYANGFVVLAEGLDMFRQGAITIGGKLTRQAICPLRKELWLN
jgi:hypothetical protein